jgi:acylphosphatase
MVWRSRAVTVQLHAIIYGKVQGVSFRHYARQEASRLGLTGWVRNLPTLSVETVAVGPPAAVEAYHQWLQHGPSDADVESIEATWGEPPATLPATFEIRYGNTP